MPIIQNHNTTQNVMASWGKTSSHKSLQELFNAFEKFKEGGFTQQELKELKDKATEIIAKFNNNQIDITLEEQETLGDIIAYEQVNRNISNPNNNHIVGSPNHKEATEEFYAWADRTASGINWTANSVNLKPNPAVRAKTYTFNSLHGDNKITKAKLDGIMDNIVKDNIRQISANPQNAVTLYVEMTVDISNPTVDIHNTFVGNPKLNAGRRQDTYNEIVNQLKNEPNIEIINGELFATRTTTIEGKDVTLKMKIVLQDKPYTQAEENMITTEYRNNLIAKLNESPQGKIVAAKLNNSPSSFNGYIEVLNRGGGFEVTFARASSNLKGVCSESELAILKTIHTAICAEQRTTGLQITGNIKYVEIQTNPDSQSVTPSKKPITSVVFGTSQENSYLTMTINTFDDKGKPIKYIVEYPIARADDDTNIKLMLNENSNNLLGEKDTVSEYLLNNGISADNLSAYFKKNNVEVSAYLGSGGHTGNVILNRLEFVDRMGFNTLSMSNKGIVYSYNKKATIINIKGIDCPANIYSVATKNEKIRYYCIARNPDGNDLPYEVYYKGDINTATDEQLNNSDMWGLVK